MEAELIQEEIKKPEDTTIVNKEESVISEHPSLPDKKEEELQKEQIKYCGTVLKALKKHKEAAAFLYPVDPVALEIPDYFDIVKNPIDLSTIQSKYGEDNYQTYEEFISDIQLMLDNCFLYNKPETFVYRNGKIIERYFYSLMEKVPRELFSSVPHRRSRERPIPGSLSFDSKKPLKMPASDVTLCNNMIREILKKKHQSFVYPFMVPVDPIALGIPDYFDIIKEPMDISTLKKKLEGNSYENSAEFKADLKRITENCFLYNQPGTVVHGMGTEFDSMIEEKWEFFLNAPKQNSGSPKAKKTRKASAQTEEDILKEIEWRRKEISTHLEKIEDLSARLKTAGSVSSRQKSQNPNTTPLIDEEKLKIVSAVNDFNEEESSELINIIKHDIPNLDCLEDDNKVITIAIENLGTPLLRKIQAYILSLRKKKAEESTEQEEISNKKERLMIDSDESDTN